MLPDLDAVDWSRELHAYGPATDVPAMLRGMRDPATARGAYADFDAAVNHQGMVTPAAIPSLPWLVALLDEPDVPLLPRLVVLLADLACGGSHINQVGGVPFPREPALRDPILPAVPRFVALLAHNDPDVRAAAALAVAMLPEAEPPSLPAVRAALQAETAAVPRASLLLALGMLGGPDDLDRVVTGKRPTDAVKGAAVLARALLDPSPDDDAVLDVLGLVGHTRRVKGLPWGEGELGVLANHLGCALFDAMEPSRVAGLIDVVDGPIQAQMAGALMRRAFPRGGPPVTDLTDAHRVALRLAATHDRALWPSRDPLMASGLPTAPRGVRVWLGDEPPGALDTAVDGEPLWRALRRCVVDGTDAGAVKVPLALAERAILELVDDAHHFLDVTWVDGESRFSHQDGPYRTNQREVAALLFADWLRPHGDAARPFFDKLLRRKRPGTLLTALAVLGLARLGHTDALDPHLLAIASAAPAQRVPRVLVEVLAMLPEDRRERVIHEVPLARVHGSLWGGEGWWLLPAFPSDRGVARVREAIGTWSASTDKRDAPFPYARFAELVAAWGPDLAARCLHGVDGPLADRLSGMLS